MILSSGMQFSKNKCRNRVWPILMFERLSQYKLSIGQKQLHLMFMCSGKINCKVQGARNTIWLQVLHKTKENHAIVVARCMLELPPGCIVLVLV